MTQATQENAAQGSLGCAVLRPGGLPRRGSVVASFERSAHLRTEDGAYLTLGRPELPAHPCSLLWDAFNGDFTPGRRAEITPDGLFCDGRLLAGFGGLAVFTPRTRATGLAGADLRRAALDASIAAAARLPLRSGFHALLAGQPAQHEEGSRLEAGLDHMTADLAGRLARRLATADWAGLASAALGLMGLGQGLTPAGDDFLAGVLSALRFHGQSLGRPVLPHLFGESLAAHAAGRTTPFSAFLLGCAASGGLARPLADWLDAAHGGRTDEAARLVTDIAEIGHSSGLDTLCGMALALTNIPGEAT
jgi:hypothetical protein